MAIIEITSWQYGFNKVACTKLLRSAGLDLAEAKGVTDGVLAGETQKLYVSSVAGAYEAVALLHAFEASAHVVEEP